MASRGELAGEVLSLRADVAVGVALTRTDLTPTSGVVPLDLLFAPVNSGARARLGCTYDRALADRGRVRGGADLWLHVATPSPLTLGASAGGDLRVGPKTRFTLGVVWFNANTRALDSETHQNVRSNDFLPTLDFI